MPSTTTYEEVLFNLVHDLRQPLGNLETGIFYLDLLLDHPAGRVRDQLQSMERQVAQASRMLQLAIDELREMKAQREAEDDESGPTGRSFERTKSATERPF